MKIYKILSHSNIISSTVNPITPL